MRMTDIKIPDGDSSGEPLLFHSLSSRVYIRARYVHCTRVYLDKIETHKQPLVKHNTLENFLRPRRGRCSRFPRRSTCIAYSEILTQSVWYFREPTCPPYIFRSHSRKCNPGWARSVPLARHRVLQTRDRPSNAGSGPFRDYLHVDTLFHLGKYIVLIHARTSHSSPLTYPDRYNSRLFSLPWLLPLLRLLSSPLATLVNEIRDIAYGIRE